MFPDSENVALDHQSYRLLKLHSKMVDFDLSYGIDKFAYLNYRRTRCTVPFEPRYEKTIVLVYDMVRHKPDCMLRDGQNKHFHVRNS